MCPDEIVTSGATAGLSSSEMFEPDSLLDKPAVAPEPDPLLGKPAVEVAGAESAKPRLTMNSN
jgi:hypothetical protein